MFVLVNLWLFACSSEVDNKPSAEVKDVPAQAEEVKPQKQIANEMKKASDVPATDAKGDTWKMAQGSTLAFVGAKVTGDHSGGFKGIDGAVSVADNAVTSVELTIDMGTTFADHPKLEAHLKNPDFFNVVEFPTATFKSSQIKDGKITGILTLIGNSKEVTFPAEVLVADGKASIKGEFTINRKVWGIEYPGKPDDLIKDEVLIKADMSFAL